MSFGSALAMVAIYRALIVSGDISGSAPAPAFPLPASPDGLPNKLPGFPETVGGEIVFCDADWIKTDAIYPGKFTYQDDVTREKMAEVCMSNLRRGVQRHRPARRHPRGRARIRGRLFSRAG